jgi:hypothetical protein
MALTEEQAREVSELAAKAFQETVENEKRIQAEAAAAKAQREAEDRALIESVTKQLSVQFAKGRRLPDQPRNQAPHVTAFADTRKYDGMAIEDLSFMIEVLGDARRSGRSREGVSESAIKALTIKIAEDKGPFGDEARRDMKAAGFDPNDVTNATKANELDYSTSAGYGDEWVGVEYSRRMWPVIRQGSQVASRVPVIEIPQGSESVVVPLESGDPTWYKVAQTTANNSTTLRPDGTIVSSRVGTDQKVLTAGKMGARVTYSMELEEDSFVPWAAQLRQQLETSGSETLEHILIDGHTTVSATTNINLIDGTPGGTEVYLLFNGFRVSPLVTTTANSRSASGSLADTDFLNTIKLMGTAGLNALDKSKVSFIVDLNVGWKVLELASLKTKDVFTNATIENGVLASIWGYPVLTSAFMHFRQPSRKANTAGKIDIGTAGNNTTGSILAVRWDQWLMGYKRRIKLSVQDFPDADASQIVAIARVGLVQRDTEAAAITYNVGV